MSSYVGRLIGEGEPAPGHTVAGRGLQRLDWVTGLAHPECAHCPRTFYPFRMSPRSDGTLVTRVESTDNRHSQATRALLRPPETRRVLTGHRRNLRRIELREQLEAPHKLREKRLHHLNLGLVRGDSALLAGQLGRRQRQR